MKDNSYEANGPWESKLQEMSELRQFRKGAVPPELLPAIDYLDIPLGAVLKSNGTDGAQVRTYVFIGWRRNTVNYEAYFAEAYEGDRIHRHHSGYEPSHYHATMLPTLLRKFPELEMYRK